jgi:hypothetical protein
VAWDNEVAWHFQQLFSGEVMGVSIPAGATRLPIDALFDDKYGPNQDIKARELIRSADVIFGIDVMTRNEFLLYGRKKLRKIAKTGKAKNLACMAIELDQDSDELEKMVALIKAVFGVVDYRWSSKPV